MTVGGYGSCEAVQEGTPMNPGFRSDIGATLS